MGNFPKYVAEFFATFALVFFGAGAICIDALTNGGVGLTGVALAHGLAIMAMVYAFGHVSGAHINPAVTFAFFMSKRMNFMDTVAYWVSQITGGVVAAFLLGGFFPDYVNLAPYLGVPALTSALPTFTMTQAFVAEFIGTFFLVSVIFGVAVDQQGLKPAAGLAIGLTVATGIFLLGPLTGAAFNPARAFGPALVTGQVSNLWLYFAAPLLGAGAAGFCYDRFFATKSKVTVASSQKYAA